MTVQSGERYRHFKGNEYEIVAVGQHSETEEEMVVYRALYGDGAVWIRPLTMFTDTVERDGNRLPRFQKI